MNFLNIDLKKWLFLLAALLLPLMTINMEQKPLESNWISRPFFFMSSVIQEGLYVFSSGIKETTAEYLNLLDIKKSNAQLQEMNNELKTRLQSYTELELENTRLKNLLEFKQKSKMNLVAAKVIGRDLVPDHNTLTINKGLRDGLKAGQAVISLSGVVGYVFRPQTLTSHIMLITDRYAVVDALIQRTRASGIVEGKGSQLLTMKYVERTDEVQEGDTVVTGGLDNIFPKGFPIAMVESVERKTMSVSLKVELRPFVDPRSMEEVFVIIDAAQEEINLPPQVQNQEPQKPIIPQ